METGAIWTIAAVTVALILIRPRRLPEAIWAASGALLLVLFNLIPLSAALTAAKKGNDVYLFLAGMMLLAELARSEGVFDWIASHAVAASNGSRLRLFALIYAAGTLVTVFLSNDATAVVLTPAVYASIRRARVTPEPYLFSCAFIANAASFVLPVSNPANLVIYASKMPALAVWFKAFLLPSAVSVAATYAALWSISRRELTGPIDGLPAMHPLTPSGRRAVWGLAIAAATLIAASAAGWDLGLVTCLAALVAIICADGGRNIIALAKNTSWSVLPLVAGLFILVEALDRAGAQQLATTALQYLDKLPNAAGSLAASFGVALLSNIANNLPSGLLAAGALQGSPAPEHIRQALLIGVDLGPNLSVTGSLATILWLSALRREGQQVSAWTFLKAGAVVMTPALALATLTTLL
jgi:arsenical pump membrane protein